MTLCVAVPFHDTGCSYHTLQIHVFILHVPVQCCAGLSGVGIPSCWSMNITFQHSSFTGGTVFLTCVFRVAHLNKS